MAKASGGAPRIKLAISMKVLTSMIKRTDMEFINGRVEIFTKENTLRMREVDKDA